MEATIELNCKNLKQFECICNYINSIKDANVIHGYNYIIK